MDLSVGSGVFTPPRRGGRFASHRQIRVRGPIREFECAERPTEAHAALRLTPPCGERVARVIHQRDNRPRHPSFREHLLYDIENQIWYEPLDDGTVRAGFTRWAANLMGEILVFTPKRLKFPFEKERSFAVVEGGKWVGSARAAFDGVVLSHNERLDRNPELLNQDPYGEGWMLVVRTSRAYATGATSLSMAGIDTPGIRCLDRDRLVQGAQQLSYRRGCKVGAAFDGKFDVDQAARMVHVGLRHQ